MRIFIDAKRVLDRMGSTWHPTVEMMELCRDIQLETSENRLLGLFTRLEAMGFVERRSDNELEPISSASWRITRQGQTYLRIAEAEELAIPAPIEEEHASINLVATVPRRFRKTINADHPEIGTTWESLIMTLSEVENQLRIICPYMDQSFDALLQTPLGKGASIRFITRPQDSATPTLRRLIDNGVIVRYIREESEGTQIYQVHAKALIVDDKVAYVGSSNLTSTSLYHNFELGLIVSQQPVVRLLVNLFDDLFENYATEG